MDAKLGVNIACDVGELSVASWYGGVLCLHASFGLCLMSGCVKLCGKGVCDWAWVWSVGLLGGLIADFQSIVQRTPTHFSFVDRLC